MMIDDAGKTDVIAAKPRSADAARPEHHPDRLDQDDHVEEDAVVLDVVEVVGELGPRILDTGAIRIVDLRPAADSRSHAMALTVVGKFPEQFIDEIRTLGAR